MTRKRTPTAHGWLARGIVWMMLWLPLAGWGGEPPAGQPLSPEDWRLRVGCLRCHAMATLSAWDHETGRRHSLAVPPREYLNSDHGNLPCQECHKEPEYQEFPHELGRPPAPRTCLECHAKDPEFHRYRLDAIATQVAKAVHREEGGAPMPCGTCHNSHTVRVSEQKPARGQRVATANASCLSCHETPLPRPGSDPQASPQARHQWLPNVNLHWETVRCVDCHTPQLGGGIHAIEPAKRAQRRCEECHTRDSVLLTKLYRHRIIEERQKAGFLNSVVLNDAYIIGMTRNELLDLLSLALVGGTGAGLAGHAGLRLWWARRRREKSHD